MEQTLLEVKNLTVSFKIRKKWVNAVEDISFKVNKCETLGIVGESGCGKSVTAMSILRLLPKNTSKIENGAIIYNGVDLSRMKNKEIGNIRGNEISMIFQDSMTSLNPVLTIGKQLLEALSVHKSMEKETAREKVLDILTKVGISSPQKRMKEYAHQLSGGMRQRVMIAMALLQNPSLIIADEPTTALDVTIQAQILDIMKELQKNGETSIMLITHDMGVVAEMADKIIVMYSGVIVEYGSVTDIFRRPLHPYTKGLLLSIPRIDKDLDILYTIEGTVPTLENMPKGCRFSNRCKESSKKCYDEKPELYSINGHDVYCFLYTKNNEGKIINES